MWRKEETSLNTTKPFKVVNLVATNTKKLPVFGVSTVLSIKISPMVLSWIKAFFLAKATGVRNSESSSYPCMNPTVSDRVPFPLNVLASLKAIYLRLISASQRAVGFVALSFPRRSFKSHSTRRAIYYLNSTPIQSSALNTTKLLFTPAFTSRTLLFSYHFLTKTAFLCFHRLTPLTPTRFVRRSALGATKLLMA